jgi:hypothetical protein
MKDDYLWDGSGEPDPDVEHLEKLLGHYRFEAKPLTAEFDRALPSRRVAWWPRLAVAAAIIAMILAGLWVVGQQRRETQSPEIAAGYQLPAQPQVNFETPASVNPKVPPVAPQPKSAGGSIVAVAPKRLPKPAPEVEKQVPSPELESAPDTTIAATALQPLTNPFVDVETAKHIERVQLLLRSFRNANDTDPANSDVAYEKQRSRALLYQNVVLRRDAEMKGNLPIQDLLGSLEPFLLDIANLPDAPTRDDVQPIKTRMQKKEIIAALQVYSAPTLSQAF